MVAPTTTPTRQRRSADEVMREMNERLPQLVPFCYMDRSWIWYCGPSLAGEENRPTREALKQIGFRFCKRGHTMQDGVTTGSWAHACDRPVFRRGGSGERHRRPVPVSRTENPAPPHARQEEEPTDWGKAFSELGL